MAVNWSGLESGTKHYQLPVHKSRYDMTNVKALRAIIQMKKRISYAHPGAGMDRLFRSRTRGRVYHNVSWILWPRVQPNHGWPAGDRPQPGDRRHMIEHLGVASRSIRYIPRSVDLEKFQEQHPEVTGKPFYTIAIVGRLTPLKGHTFFLRAMAKIVRTMPNIRIWIIGDAPAAKQSYKAELQVLTHRLGIQEHVEFLGNRKDIPQLLAQTDVLVLSTVTQEAFGRVILEAQAAGVPVVATSVGGVVDIIDDGHTGLLVMPKDPDGMAKAVMRVIMIKFAARRGGAARQNYKKFHSGTYGVPKR